MIQRPQTVYLTLSILLNLMLPFTAIADRLYSDPHGWWGYAFTSAILLAVASAGYAITLFKTRPIQANWVFRSFLFQVITVGLCSGVFFSSGPLSSRLLPDYVSLLMVIVSALMIWMARFQILKDEALVKSIDRIR
jgi:hypothetical protein